MIDWSQVREDILAIHAEAPEDWAGFPEAFPDKRVFYRLRAKQVPALDDLDLQVEAFEEEPGGGWRVIVRLVSVPK